MEDNKNLFEKMQKFKWPKNILISEDAKEFIESILNSNPQPTPDQLLDH